MSQHSRLVNLCFYCLFWKFLAPRSGAYQKSSSKMYPLQKKNQTMPPSRTPSPARGHITWSTSGTRNYFTWLHCDSDIDSKLTIFPRQNLMSYFYFTLNSPFFTCKSILLDVFGFLKSKFRWWTTSGYNKKKTTIKSQFVKAIKKNSKS